MHKRSGSVLLIVVGVVCAGLLWASQSLADLVRRTSTSRVSVAARVEPDARPRARAASSALPRTGGTFGALTRGRASIASPSLLTASLAPPSYSMAAPEYLLDPATAQARSIAVGDVSGDGRDDLVFLNLRTAPIPTDMRMEIYVAYQRGDGWLDRAVKIAESGNNLSYQLLIADLDHDGVGDIITATVDGVMILRSNADGSFRSSTAPAGDPYDMVVTDVDRDGNLDILVDSANTSATVVHGDGHGGIARTSTLPLPASGVRTTGDVTGDGLDDLILATIYNTPLEEFRIYPALPSGGYAAPVVLSLPLGSNMPASLAVGDFNGDGRGDLALDEGKDYANLRLYFQDAQGKLGSPLEIARQRGGSTNSLIATDLNRDGRSDLAIAHSGWGYVGYYLQAGTGLAPEALVEANQYSGRWNFFATGDLNHDNCGDLVISRWSQSPVVLYGQCHRRIADCALPPVAVGSGLQAVELAYPLVRQRSGGMGTNVKAGLTRGARR